MAEQGSSFIARGRLYALIAAIFFGGITTFARLAYEGGSNPYTVVLVRFVFGVIFVAVAVVILRQSFRLPRHMWPAVLGVSIGWFAATVGHLSSVLFIPVSLAVLIFYTFPLMVAAAAHFIYGEQLGLLKVLAFLIAFIGLALALGPSSDTLDWRGVVLVVFGAMGSAATLLLSRRLSRSLGPFTLTFYVNVVNTILIVGVISVMGDIAWPYTASGWVGVTGGTLCFVIAILVMFAAVARVGPATTAMILNVEPLIAIIAAAVLLGERLTAVQLVGGALVFAALVLSSFKSASVKLQ